MTTRRRTRRPRSPDALKQAAYRARLRDGIAIAPTPINNRIVDLVRVHLPPGEAATRAEIGRAIAAYLDRRARSER
jgi:hypothetical protein